MYEKKIAVIVPVYNVSQYIEQCVNSLREQTYHNIEIILVDDGSTDDSGIKCDTYAEEDSRIHVLHKVNGGLMSAWTVGVLESSCEYVMFVDSDDWIDKDTIESMANNLQAGDKKAVICCNCLIEKEAESTPSTHGMEPGSYLRKDIENKIIPNILGYEQRRIGMSRCMKLTARELILENLKYCNEKIKMGEDLNIMLPVLLDSEKIVVLQDAFFYHYRFLETSMVHKYDAKMKENMLLLYEIIKKVLEEKKILNREEMAKKEFLYLLFYLMKNEIRGPKATYQKSIQEICKEAEIKEMIKRIPVETKEKVNQLLYLMMKHPNTAVILGNRVIFRLFDRVKR